jgi:CBS domain containing-hemolysin-like protein
MPRLLGVAIPVLGLLTLALHMAGVALRHALRTYSRSRLEELCLRRGHEERADAIAHADEPTERAAEALATLTGLVLAALLGAAADELGSALRAEVLIGVSLLVVAVGHIAAAVVGRVHAESVVDRAWPLAGALRLAMSPLTDLHRAIERLAYRRSRRGAGLARPASVEVEVLSLSTAADDETALDAELPDAIRDMLARLIELTRLDAARLMVPAAQMQMLPANVSGPVAARAFAESGYSRIPLYGVSRDDIVGILYAKDLLARLVEAGDPASIVPRKLAREALRVPETKNAAELLDELRARSVQMAIVFDEYGGVVGLISLEDLLESFIGPIQDEHDEPPPPDPVVTLGGSSYDVDAALPLDELNERLGLRLPTDEDYSTLGGLVLHALGHLPQPGETLRRDGVEFTVLSVQGRAVRRLLVRFLPATPDPAASVGGP